MFLYLMFLGATNVHVYLTELVMMLLKIAKHFLNRAPFDFAIPAFTETTETFHQDMVGGFNPPEKY